MFDAVFTRCEGQIRDRKIVVERRKNPKKYKRDQKVGNPEKSRVWWRYSPNTLKMDKSFAHRAPGTDTGSTETRLVKLPLPGVYPLSQEVT